MTECGHSFCQKCIEASLDKRNQCPKCNFTLQPDRLYPNFTLNEVILKHKQKVSNSNLLVSSSSLSVSSVVDSLLNDELDNKISYQNVSSIISILEQKRKRLLLETEIGHVNLTLDFLNQMKYLKETKLQMLQQEISLISNDVETVSVYFIARNQMIL